MSWNSWQDFWAMGGYGLYVWGSYGVTATLIVVEIAMSRIRRRNALAALRGEGVHR
jgi:heme exporter protein D